MSKNENKENTTGSPDQPQEPQNDTSVDAEAPAEQAQPVDDAAQVAEQEALAAQQAEEERMAAEEVEKTKYSMLRPGMTVRVHQKIQEGEKQRIQVFQGIIIALRGKTHETKTMTVQKNSFGILVDKIFPLASPLIEKIEVVKIARVRRAKLYFLSKYRKRLKETLVKQAK